MSVAYYLVHSMCGGPDFAARDREAARNFVAALSGVQEVLERRTERGSALLLRDVLGTIRLVPEKGDVGRPFYLAQTAIDGIALLETPPGSKAPDGGSNLLRQWRRRESRILDP